MYFLWKVTFINYLAFVNDSSIASQIHVYGMFVGSVSSLIVYLYSPRRPEIQRLTIRLSCVRWESTILIMTIMFQFRRCLFIYSLFRCNMSRRKQHLLCIIHDGIESVCDGKDRTFFKLCSDRWLDEIVRFQVDSRGRFIEHEHLCLPEQSTCETHELTLSNTET